jgi:hypothetical protein
MLLQSPWIFHVFDTMTKASSAPSAKKSPILDRLYARCRNVAARFVFGSKSTLHRLQQKRHPIVFLSKLVEPTCQRLTFVRRLEYCHVRSTRKNHGDTHKFQIILTAAMQLVLHVAMRSAHNQTERRPHHPQSGAVTPSRSDLFYRVLDDFRFHRVVRSTRVYKVSSLAPDGASSRTPARRMVKCLMIIIVVVR